MKVHIIGNGLDALICSKRLLELGHQVTLFSTTENLGGHFSGHTIGHGNFDLGMVLLENDHRSVPSLKFKEFKNQFGRNLRPFLSESFEWLTKIVGSLEKEIIVTKLPSGDEIPDYFIADNLNFLDFLNEETRNDLVQNIKNFLYETDHEAKIKPEKKMIDDKFKTLSLSEYYTQIFGRKFFEEHFENFLTCVSAEFSRVLARDHRKFWLPLYFPESIYFALTHDLEFKEYALSELRFDKPKDMMISDLVSKIAEDCFANPNFQQMTVKTFSNLTINQVRFEKCVLFLSSEQIHKLFPENLRLKELHDEVVKATETLGTHSINIIHACIPTNRNMTVMFKRDYHGLFRYSISQKKNNLECSVASFEFKNSNDFNFVDSIKVIRSLGFDVLCDGGHVRVPFNAKWLNLTQVQWQELSLDFTFELQAYNVQGSVIHPEATTFNDNLVRGLAYAEQVHLREWEKNAKIG